MRGQPKDDLIVFKDNHERNLKKAKKMKLLIEVIFTHRLSLESGKIQTVISEIKEWKCTYLCLSRDILKQLISTTVRF